MIDELLKRRVIPVIVLDDAKDAEPLAEALLAGGMDIIEITCRTPAAFDAIERLAKSIPDMLVGAGTVVTALQAQRCIDAGARFGLAPGLNPRTVNFFRDKGVAFVPGTVNPTDIEAAFELGCTYLKFFPAGAAGGPSMLKSMAGPYSSLGIRFCPTGGVSLSNMADYLSLPMVGAVGGSWIATREQITNGEWSRITEQAREAIARAGEIG